MTRLHTDHLLSLVQRALDEIDDRPVDVTARRAARIASLIGETELAVYLGLELKPLGGNPPANAEDTRRLMADPSLWGEPDGPAEAAMTTYIGARRITSGSNEGKIAGYGLAEVEALLASLGDDSPGEGLDARLMMHGIRERVRHTIFAACVRGSGG